ncbi:hydroxymethylglutaryl-CoA lyase [Limobrevibacterium gyesilva]|uniref:Hydroxymethylglutaryl-CoA lyase n=1 Tax=Limobrevibacterium gyesilva TaxID=2991712 RepID=A0AA41YJ11_9PROT|nr:hydroxymethylglutaryl-CoA lyase [Limobrevibacterium gyesilva]MCW3474039.1 hydroxymethylglutaryl-CoA lyase [Limobrevibacterium gyesilva]
MHHVVLREVGLRDGLQSLAQFMPTAAKCAWIAAEHAAGVNEIEVSSFVPPKLLPQFADAEQVVQYALTLPGLTVSALIPNLRGAERGLALGVHKLNYVLSASESHNRNNVRRSTQESVDDFARIVAAARGAANRPILCAGLATSFGCTIEGAVDEDRVRRLAGELAAAGADELVLADTVGYGDPAAVRRVFAAVKQEVGDMVVGAHFHDTRGLGIANVQAALEMGVRHFDASLAGLGGCPFAPGATGNIVTEDTAFLCETLGYDTGIDIERLVRVRPILAANLQDTALLGNLAKAGLPKHFVPARQRAQTEAAQ